MGMHLVTYPIFLGLLWLSSGKPPVLSVGVGEGLIMLIEGGLIYLMCVMCRRQIGTALGVVIQKPVCIIGRKHLFGGGFSARDDLFWFDRCFHRSDDWPLTSFPFFKSFGSIFG